MNEFYFTTPNRQRRSITIRHYKDGKRIAKYRTIRLNKTDFLYYSDYASQSDWQKFLETRPDDFYIVDGVAERHGKQVRVRENPQAHEHQTKAKSFLHWYEVGKFADLLAETIETEPTRAEQVFNITHNVSLFSVMNQEFRNTERERVGDPVFILNFSMYLVGRLDERLNNQKPQ